MLSRLQTYIDKSDLFDREEVLVVAVSGGIDSVVMLHMLHQLGCKSCIVAHMNFSLRGAESDEDETFVKNLAGELQYEFRSKKVNTLEYADQEKISTQMAARVLRYTWFNELMISYGATKILTAHHADDSIETIFINLFRGTGLAGLKGITSNHGVVRPMLCFHRKEIEAFAIKNGIRWREDSSNAKDDYLRNRIRHKILPELDQLSKQWRSNLLDLASDLNEAEQFIKISGSKILDQLKADGKIPKGWLAEDNFLQKWAITSYLKSIGFTAAQVELLFKSSFETGARFYSNSHEILVDRDFLLIRKIAAEHGQIAVPLEVHQEEIQFGQFILKIQSIPKLDFSGAYGDKSEAWLDFDKLDFPLTIRPWHAGDWFVPLGMQGKKKLSDYFIDQKFSIHQKENTFVLSSGQQVVWVIGERIDNRFKVTADTERIYQIKLSNV